MLVDETRDRCREQMYRVPGGIFPRMETLKRFADENRNTLT